MCIFCFLIYTGFMNAFDEKLISAFAKYVMNSCFTETIEYTELSSKKNYLNFIFYLVLGHLDRRSRNINLRISDPYRSST